jgi:hypothetical protein
LPILNCPGAVFPLPGKNPGEQVISTPFILALGIAKLIPHLIVMICVTALVASTPIGIVPGGIYIVCGIIPGISIAIEVS